MFFRKSASEQEKDIFDSVNEIPPAIKVALEAVALRDQCEKVIYYKKWLDFIPQIKDIWKETNENLADFILRLQIEYVYQSKYISYSAGIPSSFLSIINRSACNCIDSSLFLIACAHTVTQEKTCLVVTDNHACLALKDNKLNTLLNLETTLRIDNTTDIRFIRWLSTNETGQIIGMHETTDDINEIVAIYVAGLMRNANNLRENEILTYEESKRIQDNLYGCLVRNNYIVNITLPTTLIDIARYFLYNLNIVAALDTLKKSLLLSKSRNVLTENALFIILKNIQAICENYRFWSNKYDSKDIKDILEDIKTLSRDVMTEFQYTNSLSNAKTIYDNIELWIDNKILEMDRKHNKS